MVKQTIDRFSKGITLVKKPQRTFFEKFVYTAFFVGFALIAYLYYLYDKNSRQISPVIQSQSMNQPPVMVSVSTRNSPEFDGPPLRNDGVFFPRDSTDIRGGIPLANVPISVVSGGIPINQQTRGVNTEYSQVGILTREAKNGGEKLILPFMGRQLTLRPEKWQYYTTSNTGQLNTRLPVRFNGKSCTGEQGCDYINSGDVVYVEGYDEQFRATIYENSVFRYIPYI